MSVQKPKNSQARLDENGRRIFAEPVLVLGGGEVNDGSFNAARALTSAVICADGGVEHALARSVTPELVIGDMDSASAAAKAMFSERLVPVEEQDTTDFQKCLDRIKAPACLCVGFTGGRLDHQLAALSQVAGRSEQCILLVSEREVVFRLPERISLALPKETPLSLFPFSKAKVRSTGLAWPVDGLDLAPSGQISTSNSTSGTDQEIICDEGDLLVIIPLKHLDMIVTELTGGPIA